MRYFVSVVVIALTIVAAGCAQIPEVCSGCSNPWENSERNSTFQSPEPANYKLYVRAKRKILERDKHFPEWTSKSQQTEFIKRIAPTLREPNSPKCDGVAMRRGIVLIHGLFDTPFIMQDLAKHFVERCFTVYEVLLTGHGTRPGDLLSVSREEWKREIGYVVKSASREFKELYIGGFSLGGALSIFAANEYDGIKAVLLFAPALRPTNKLAYGSVLLNKFGAGFFKVFEELDYAKYESLSHNAGSETYLLGLEVEEYLEAGIRKPLFVAVSLEDATIDAWHTVETVGQAPMVAASRTVIFASKANQAQALCRRHQKKNPAFACRVISSDDPSMGVKSLSHIGLVVAPGNDHYGMNGDYRNCLYSTSQKRLCLKSEINKDTCQKKLICYGEAIEATAGPVIRRITFNPFFQELTAEIDRFLQKLGE